MYMMFLPKSSMNPLIIVLFCFSDRGKRRLEIQIITLFRTRGKFVIQRIHRRFSEKFAIGKQQTA